MVFEMKPNIEEIEAILRKAMDDHEEKIVGKIPHGSVAEEIEWRKILIIQGFSAGHEAGKEQGKYDYAALNLVLENVEERTGQEISSLKMDMKILNADLRNEKQLTGIYEDKLAEAQDNLRITTIVCENAINEREAERKNMDEAYTILKLFPIKSGTLERAMSLLKSRKQGSETKVITPSQKDHYNITKKEKGSELLTTTNSEGKTSNKDKSTSEKGTTNKSEQKEAE